MNTYKARIRRQHDFYWLKQLVWAYFFLLIFEGALRKWVVPSASNLLLIIRDPVVILAYFLAWRSGLFPRNIFITILVALALATLTAGVFVSTETPIIAFYGFRTNFLQWPFIFIIARVFKARDVERLGYWVLVIAIPMAVLMVFQFLAPTNSFLNTGVGDDTSQIMSALGRIRPPGTFSYVTGPVLLYSTTAAFLLYNQFGKRYPVWLIGAATVATLCAAAVSGSRSLVASIAVVFVFGLVSSFFLRPQIAFRWLGSLVVLGVIVFFLRDLSFFKTGLEVFSARVSGASEYEGGSTGFVNRYLAAYTGFLPSLYDAPLFGRGLGMGTVVGLALMVDKSQFIWFEDEWGRHVLESGPLLGLAFIFYRIAFTAWLSSVCLRHMARYDPLPVLLLGVCLLSLLTGTTGQVTIMGFMILISGLCLAATRVPGKRVAKIAASSAPEVAADAEDNAVEAALSASR